MQADDNALIGRDVGATNAMLSPSLLAQRVAGHLGQIGQELLALERSILTSAGPKTAEERAQFQSLDQIVQTLTGLAHVLGECAPLLADQPDRRLNEIVARPRLSSLEDALLGTQSTSLERHIDLF